MFLLHPSTANQSQDRKLDFKPQDSLTEFVSFEDLPSLTTATTVPVVGATLPTPPQHYQPRNTARSSSTHGQQRPQNRSPSTHANYSSSPRSPSLYYCYSCKRT